MDVNYHFVCDRVDVKTLQVSFCSSKDQIVDVLTKPLVSEKFSMFRSSLIVVTTPLDSTGHMNLDNFVIHTLGSKHAF